MDILATYCLGDGARVAGHWTLESGDSFLTLPQTQTTLQTTLRQDITNGYRAAAAARGQEVARSSHQPGDWRLEGGEI